MKALRQLKRSLKKLDTLHVTLLCLLAFMSGVGWWAAGQCEQARIEGARWKQQYLKLLYHGQPPPPPKLYQPDTNL